MIEINDSTTSLLLFLLSLESFGSASIIHRVQLHSAHRLSQRHWHTESLVVLGSSSVFLSHLLKSSSHIGAIKSTCLNIRQASITGCPSPRFILTHRTVQITLITNNNDWETSWISRIDIINKVLLPLAQLFKRVAVGKVKTQ